jgi:histidyl-tRNA synthetase
LAAGPLAFHAAEALRSAGLEVVMNAGSGSFKSQFKRADASGAAFAVVIGEDEAAASVAMVKALRGPMGEQGQGSQRPVPLDQLVDVLIDALVADVE